MELIIKQISSLEKVRRNDPLPNGEIHKKTVLAGERFSYQISVKSQSKIFADVELESPLADSIRLFRVQDAVMDTPVTYNPPMEDYITHEPGLMPDILIPLSEYNNKVSFNPQANTIWVRVDVPKDTPAGNYTIRLKFTMMFHGTEPVGEFYKTMTLTVIPAVIPDNKIIYTRWFYLDCVAVAHNVEIFSEAHWALIEKYIEAAADMGINMLLVPVHTPPLDTEIGTRRPCVQLVDIEKKGDTYEFSFDRFRRYIALCKKYGIRYYEIAHMFSQWGAKCAPNIMVTENGKTDYMFGWHVAAHSDAYVSFLKQYIQAISTELDREGISEYSFFHISDEPVLGNMDTYKTASEIIRPLIGNSKTFDALSNFEFYEKGLVECPVTSVHSIHEFLEHPIENQWAYYCCGPQEIFTNAFMAMPSYRIRVLGYQLYKYDIKGFLHWGYNFYNAARSYYPINPYVTTSSDGAHPSGDAFVVYPATDGVYTSLRAEVLYDAFQDIRVCQALEAHIGREAVIQMIDEAAGFDFRFDEYPRSKEFLEDLRAKMTAKLAELS